MLKLYENIKQHRKAAGLTQEELAHKVGYTDRSSIAKIERGLVDIPQSKIKQFAEVFGVLPGDLMGWEEPEPEDLGEIAAAVLEAPGILRMVQDYLSLSEDDQAVARALISSLAEKKKD